MTKIARNPADTALVIRELKSAVVRSVGRLCIHDGICERKAVSRGLCRSHAQALYRLIRESNGAITLEQMERAGRCLPLRRPAKAFFLEAVIESN